MNAQNTSLLSPVRTRRAKRVEFSIVGGGGKTLHEPGFVDDCRDLPGAIMMAVEDFMEANEGKLRLPLTIHVQGSSDEPSC